MLSDQTTLGVVIGNRDFFPDALVTEARRDVLDVLCARGIDSVILDEQTTELGGVETWQDAQRCAELFRANRERIDGVLVVLPNFGDERGIADTIKLSGLDVPILLQAYPDDLDAFQIERRRDAFCGKISVANALCQYGYPFTLTEEHTVHPRSEAFADDLDTFLGVCRVVNGIRKARLGALGARPTAFNTVRYSEKLLQSFGISVCTADLSEILGEAERLDPDSQRARAKRQELDDYLPSPGVPDEALAKMASLGAAIDAWIEENAVDAIAFQCWNSIQTNYGVNPCTIMSMLSDRLLPSACEVDIMGALSMYALQLATRTPSLLADWNNNYGCGSDRDRDRCVLFHCSNWPKTFFGALGGTMAYADVLATTLGRDRTYGAIAGRIPAGPMSYARISTDDVVGEIRAYVGEGEFTDDPLDTIGGRAVVRVDRLQSLLKYVCKNGFEHHCAISGARSADVLEEALSTYMGWDVYRHS